MIRLIPRAAAAIPTNTLTSTAPIKTFLIMPTPIAMEAIAAMMSSARCFASLLEYLAKASSRIPIRTAQSPISSTARRLSCPAKKSQLSQLRLQRPHG